MGKLEGKITLITGGEGGVGFATAKRFVNEGAYVFITGRDDTDLAATVKEIGRNVAVVSADVSKVSDLDRLLAQIEREKGKLDTVFANLCPPKSVPFRTTTQEYDSVFNTTVKSLFLTVQKALPLLVDGASIILNTSFAASKGKNETTNSLYTVTEVALRALTHTWTVDLKRRRIRLNAVPIRKLVTPDEIARAAVFLASDESSGITGTGLFADGELITNHVSAGRLATPDEITRSVAFLASEEGGSMTGMESSSSGDLAKTASKQKHKQ